ncbi:MAG TPA: hypothetical protein VFI33_16620 [Puia sp.]|nr:hypothetical protein [Puia sp.]
MEFLTGKVSTIPDRLVFEFGIFAVVLMVCSCSQSSEKSYKEEKKDQAPAHKIAKKPPSSFEDTVIVDRKSAVFFNPDSLQLEKIRLVNEKMVYETMTHDCYYMMQNARNVIRKHWPGIRVVEVVKASHLLFIKKDKSKICIDLNAKPNICGLFLFDPKKDPEPVDMPNIDTFLGFYFGQ